MTKEERFNMVELFVHAIYHSKNDNCMNCVPAFPRPGYVNCACPGADKINAMIHILKSVGICYIYLNLKMLEHRQNVRFWPNRTDLGECITVKYFLQLIKEIIGESESNTSGKC